MSKDKGQPGVGVPDVLAFLGKFQGAGGILA
jgi:hypothetical protein